MILPEVRLLRKLTYLVESRQLAQNVNPLAKARFWPQIGVLQKPLKDIVMNKILAFLFLFVSTLCFGEATEVQLETNDLYEWAFQEGEDNYFFEMKFINSIEFPENFYYFTSRNKTRAEINCDFEKSPLIVIKEGTLFEIKKIYIQAILSKVEADAIEYELISTIAYAALVEGRKINVNKIKTKKGQFKGSVNFTATPAYVTSLEDPNYCQLQFKKI